MGTYTRGAMAESGGKQDFGIYLYAGALLAVCVGVSPIPGTLLSAGLPLLPEMPNMPKVELPDLPSIKMPEVPTFGLPSMPSLSLPEVPSLPDLPNFQLPALPEIPSVKMPSIDLAATVSSTISAVTDTASTVGEETKTAFANLWQKIAAWPLWRILSLGDVVEEKSNPMIEPEPEISEDVAAQIAAEETAAAEAAAVAAEEAARIAAEEAAKISAAEEAAQLAAAEEADQIAAAEEEARVAAAEEA